MEEKNRDRNNRRDRWFFNTSRGKKMMEYTRVLNSQQFNSIFELRPGIIMTGIYLLFDENKQLLYVGQSSNIYRRIQQHIIGQVIPFCFYKYLIVPTANLDSDERGLIIELKPKFNNQLSGGTSIESIDDCLYLRLPPHLIPLLEKKKWKDSKNLIWSFNERGNIEITDTK
jgi:hypothetical protein